MKTIFKLIPIFILLVSCNQNGDNVRQDLTTFGPPEPEMRYLAQILPGTTAELFAPGIVSTEAIELNSVFTPDGREFFFTRLIEGPDESEGYPGNTRPILHHMRYEDGAWSKPRPLRLFPDAPHTLAADMSVSPDGLRFYFMGSHTVDAESERSDLNLWVSHREDGGWSVAEPLPEPVNSEANEIYSSVVADGSLYFTSNRPGASASGRSGLFRAQALDDGGFAEPLNAGIEPERGLGDTFVAPDESYAIFTGRRDGGYGGGDLWVVFRGADGGWGEPVNLGPEVNSEILDYCPMVTPDGKYLFFSRRHSDPPGGWPNVVEGNVYWVDASVIERLRPTEGAGQKSDSRVEGVWRLVEYHDWNTDGTEIESLGNQAPGIFVYTPEGNLSLHIMTQSDRPLVNSETSNEELGEIYRPYIGYFGTYSVDYEAMTITHNIEGAKLPNRIGRAATRTFYFDDGDLVLDFTNSEGRRYYRRLKKVESLRSEK